MTPARRHRTQRALCAWYRACRDRRGLRRDLSLLLRRLDGRRFPLPYERTFITKRSYLGGALRPSGSASGPGYLAFLIPVSGVTPILVNRANAVITFDVLRGHSRAWLSEGVAQTFGAGCEFGGRFFASQ